MSGVINATQGLYQVRLCQIAFSFLAIYDHVLTFDREIALIWKQQFSIRTAMFLMNRYIGGCILIANVVVPFASPTSDNIDGKYLQFQAWGTAVIVWSVQATLQYRIHAMHSFSRPVLIFMNTAFAIEIAAMSVMLGLFSATTMTVPIIANLPQDSRKYFYIFTVPIIALECVSLAFLLWGGMKHILEMKRTLPSWSVSSIYRVPLRDGAAYFIATTAILSIAGSVWMKQDTAWIEAPLGIALAIPVISGARLVLNLRLITHYKLALDDLGEIPSPLTGPSPITFSTSHADEEVELDYLPNLRSPPRSVQFSNARTRS
ncbi:hypothetical protein BJ138DRAFT_1140270 [Hygrophoropsis aurantiaca]|uniref:Uncharacterized protein n=1 Tax=Hygrophoropsis aurantiaca TaxID=72124 RepID=A0ACB8ATM8_9AGAM|nr:hypothetical protein BJ138DRAFT_1140270 [Hygrophoropsis aurantiaca]